MRLLFTCRKKKGKKKEGKTWNWKRNIHLNPYTHREKINHFFFLHVIPYTAIKIWTSIEHYLFMDSQKKKTKKKNKNKNINLFHSFYIYDWLIVSLFEQNKTQNSGQLDCVPGFPLIRWVFPRKTWMPYQVLSFYYLFTVFTYLFLVYFGVDDNKQIILLIFICIYIYIRMSWNDNVRPVLYK